MTRIGGRVRYAVLGPVAGLALALGWLVTDRVLHTDDRPVQVAPAALQAGPAGNGGPVPAAAAAGNAAGAELEADEQDRRILERKLEFARAERLDTLLLGEAMARLGVTFVGTTYTPGTLEAPGPERLVINLRELDCVTFVENVLAISRLARSGERDFDAYRAELTRIRYRGGAIDGYPSRLHYFSEWIADNERNGLVRDVTRELGGVQDATSIDFMSTHVDAYRQLADADNLARIRETEAALSARPRYYIPQDRIAAVAPMIRNGDIIAATSTVAGLDVAHTGIALWQDGRLHLLHAPLVGKAVEISALPLEERIQGIGSQDGIMVARPL